MCFINKLINQAYAGDLIELVLKILQTTNKLLKDSHSVLFIQQMILSLHDMPSLCKTRLGRISFRYEKKTLLCVPRTYSEPIFVIFFFVKLFLWLRFLCVNKYANKRKIHQMFVQAAMGSFHANKLTTLCLDTVEGFLE